MNGKLNSKPGFTEGAEHSNTSFRNSRLFTWSPFAVSQRYIYAQAKTLHVES
jgi:hypothetical protein